MNAKDFLNLKQLAIGYYRTLEAGLTLEGGDKVIVGEDLRILALYEATLELLNSKGAFKESALQDNRISFIQTDSLPMEDDYL